MQVESVAIAKLVFDPANARKHSARNLDAIKGSLTKFGQQKPIVIDAKGVVVAGNGTLAAAKDLGWDKIDAVRTKLEGPEAIAFALADNRTAELAEWDTEILTETLKALKDIDFDLDAIGFDEDFMTALAPAGGTEGLTDPDDVPESVETRCKPGDLWILGDHRLLCGDSTNVQHVERLMGGEKADMLFTDPPYGVNYEGGHFHSGDVKVVRKREKLASDETAAIYSDVIPLIPQFVDGPCYTWFADTRPLELFQAVHEVGQTHALIIWHKTNATYAAMNAQYKQRHEPCLYWKPKGSTLIACEKTGRRCFGMEIDPKYCDVILARWEKFTGKTASLETEA